MNIQLLLSEVSQISKKYELINQKTGGYFNIFDIVNVSTDEVTICKMLKKLKLKNDLQVGHLIAIALSFLSLFITTIITQ
jgi:hypothetical protein